MAFPTATEKPSITCPPAPDEHPATEPSKPFVPKTPKTPKSKSPKSKTPKSKTPKQLDATKGDHKEYTTNTAEGFGNDKYAQDLLSEAH